MRLIVFLFLVVPCAGFGALQWAWRFAFHRAGMNPQDRDRTAAFFGIAGPDLAPAWRRLRQGDAVNRPWSFHLIKDVMSEWVKLDAQRGGKFLSMLILLWFSIAVVAIAGDAVLWWLR